MYTPGNPDTDRAQVSPRVVEHHGELGLGLYTILPSPLLYASRHTKGGSVRGRILPNGRATVLQ